jgi:hypothetical protein
MMGRQETGQAPLFYAFNLEEHAPANHLLRGIDWFLDLSELHRHLAPHYSHTESDRCAPGFARAAVTRTAAPRSDPGRRPSTPA